MHTHVDQIGAEVEGWASGSISHPCFYSFIQLAHGGGHLNSIGLVLEKSEKRGCLNLFIPLKEEHETCSEDRCSWVEMGVKEASGSRHGPSWNIWAGMLGCRNYSSDTHESEGENPSCFQNKTFIYCSSVIIKLKFGEMKDPIKIKNSYQLILLSAIYLEYWLSLHISLCFTDFLHQDPD